MASIKTTLNEKDYLDNSGHSPAMRRMWLNDMSHLSAVTGHSCRGRLLAVCPELMGCLLGSWQHVADEASMSQAAWERSPQLQPSTAQRTKVA